MAVFNPETGVGNPNFLEYSRGSIPDRSAGMKLEGKGDALRAKGALKQGQGNVLEGLGDVFKMGLEVGDRYVKDNIRKDVESIDAESNDFWGVDSAMQVAGVEAPRRGTAQPLPDDLMYRREQLGLLKGAFESGRLTSSHFYGRLAMAVKELRQKYPGYRQEVDDIVADVTGLNPANALRNQLLQDWESASKENADVQSKEWAWVHQHTGDMSASTYDRWVAGQLPFEQVVHEVRKRQFNRASVDDAASLVGLNAAQGVADKKQATSAAMREVSTVLNEFITDTTRMAAPNGQSLMAMIKTAGEDKVFKPDEVTQITQYLSTIQQGLYGEVLQRLTRPLNENGDSYTTILEGDTQNIYKMVDDHFKVLSDAVTNGQYGIIAANQMRIDAQGQSDMLKALEDRWLRGVNVLNKLGLSEWVNTSFMNDNEIFNDVTQTIKNLAFLETASGQVKPFTETAQEMINAGADPKGVLSSINQHVDLIINPDTPLQAAETAAQKFFAPENNGFIALFKKGDQTRLFTDLVSPKMTARMRELGNSNPELWNNYRNWVMDKSQNFIKPVASELQGLFEQSNGMVSFDYDAETGEVVVNAAPLAKAKDPMVYQSQIDVAMAHAEEVNKYLRAINPMLEADGKDKSKVVIDLFNSFGVRLKSVSDGEGSPAQDDGSASISGNVQLVGMGSDVQAMNMLRDFEGFSESAYYDVNAWRIGYGSDTITDASGNVRRVTPDDVVTKEDAERDLKRRTPEFQRVAIRQVGEDNWNELPENIKAAVTSIVYNYGEVPKRIRTAIIDGDPQVIAHAVESLQDDNAGINRGRRKKEAQHVLAGL
jgi:GH24 family phage-related lysozyme (muramidase)